MISALWRLMPSWKDMAESDGSRMLPRGGTAGLYCGSRATLHRALSARACTLCYAVKPGKALVAHELQFGRRRQAGAPTHVCIHEEHEVVALPPRLEMRGRLRRVDERLCRQQPVFGKRDLAPGR